MHVVQRRSMHVVQRRSMHGADLYAKPHKHAFEGSRLQHNVDEVAGQSPPHACVNPKTLHQALLIGKLMTTWSFQTACRFTDLHPDLELPTWSKPMHVSCNCG